MKYILEVLGESNGTQIFSHIDDAKDALKSWGRHRPGQPVLALYFDDEGEKAGLLAAGTGGPNDYCIIAGNEEVFNTYFTQISAGNVILDSIDITKLLSSTGPGQKFDDDAGYERWENVSKHFGWLGTTSASWATRKYKGHIITNSGLTVQEMFEAILHGKEITSTDIPNISVYIRKNDGDEWVQQLTIIETSEEEFTVQLKYVIDNYAQLNLDNISVEGNEYHTLTLQDFENGGEYIVDYTVEGPCEKEFMMSAWNINNPDDMAFDSAMLYVISNPDDEDDLNIETDKAILS